MHESSSVIDQIYERHRQVTAKVPIICSGVSAGTDASRNLLRTFSERGQWCEGWCEGRW